MSSFEKFSEALGDVAELNGMNITEIKKRYRTQSMKAHPDRGGTVAEQVSVNQAWEQISACLIGDTFSGAVAKQLFGSEETTHTAGHAAASTGTSVPAEKSASQQAPESYVRRSRKYEKPPKVAYRTVDTIAFETVLTVLWFAVTQRQVSVFAGLVVAGFGIQSRSIMRLANPGWIGAVGYGTWIAFRSHFNDARTVVAVTVVACCVAYLTVHVPLYWWRSIATQETRSWLRSKRDS